MEKFGKNIFTETICKDSTSRIVGGNMNSFKQSSENSSSTNSKNKGNKNNEPEVIDKNHKNGEYDNKVKENKEIKLVSDSSSLEGFSDKKIKQLIYLSNNSNSIKLEEIQTVTWNGLPFGKKRIYNITIFITML